HLRASLDAAPLGLGVELVAGGAAGAAVRAQPAAPGRGHVLLGLPARRPRLTAARPLLVHRARGDLLGPSRALPAVAGALPDVLVLPLPLGARSPGYVRPPSSHPYRWETRLTPGARGGRARNVARLALWYI